MRRNRTAETGSDRMQAMLTGGPGGPCGWTLSNGSGAARMVSLEALVCMEHQLRTDGDTDAADDMYRQITTLAHVAEAWRHPDCHHGRQPAGVGP